MFHGHGLARVSQLGVLAESLLSMLRNVPRSQQQPIQSSGLCSDHSSDTACDRRPHFSLDITGLDWVTDSAEDSYQLLASAHHVDSSKGLLLTDSPGAGDFRTGGNSPRFELTPVLAVYVRSAAPSRPAGWP